MSTDLTAEKQVIDNANQTAVKQVLLDRNRTMSRRLDKIYSKQELKRIKAHTLHSGIITDDLGKFQPIYKKLKSLAKAGNANQPKFLASCEKLRSEISKYMANFDDQGSRKKNEALKTTEAGVRRANKLKICRMILSDLAIFEAQCNHPNEAQFLIDIEERAAQNEPVEQGELNKYRETLATVLIAELGTSKPPSEDEASSDVDLIRKGDGTVAFAFKSIEGESTQMGIPPGAGALRETLTAQLCSFVDDQCKIGFNWPAASMAELSIDNQKKVGVLVAGLPGRPADKFDDDTLQNLEASEVQKLALCDLAFGQFDIKWDNAFLDPTDQKLYPFDGGAALPSNHMLVTQMLSEQLEDLGKPILQDQQGNKLSSATKNLDASLRDCFMKIDTTELARVAKTELGRLGKFGLDDPELGGSEGTHFAIWSIQEIQKILNDNDPITLEELITKYRDDVLIPMVKQMVPKWESDIRKQYLKLYNLLQGMIPKPVAKDQEDNNTCPLAVFNNYLDPAQQARLRQIEKSGGLGMLKKYNVNLPTFSFKTAFARARRNIPESDRGQFPFLFPPRN